jgi:hypothetical protein
LRFTIPFELPPVLGERGAHAASGKSPELVSFHRSKQDLKKYGIFLNNKDAKKN